MRSKNKLILILAVIVVLPILLYIYNLKPVSKDSSLKEIEIPKGSSYSTIGTILEENKLIKSNIFYKIYVKLNKPKGLEACTYTLSEDMGVKNIIQTLQKSCSNSGVKMTFKEGLNMRQITKIITENTNNKEEDVYSLLKDEKYLDELIAKYWFLNPIIKNSKIYYSLEGYLYPETYIFEDKNTKIETIFELMLDETDKQLSTYKEELEKSGKSVHEILTLASIIELEAGNSDDRHGVAGVFYNRLNDNWSLGSDVTTYYAIKVEMHERELYMTELNDYNDYNTRSLKMSGKLPISPICNPSIGSIKSTIEPTKHDKYYFVADKNYKTYFTKTEQEHQKIIKELRSKGLWFEY